MDKNLVLIKTNFAVRNHKDIINLVPFDIRFVFGANFQITDGTLVARSNWFKKYKYDEKVRWSEDFDLMIRGVKDSLYANIKEPLYVYLRTGTTSPIKSQIKSIKQRTISILKYRHNLPSKMLFLLSFVSLLLRPIFIIITGIYHKVVNIKILSSTLPPQVSKDLELIKNINITVNNK